MSTLADLIAELRALFKDGATPSRLIRCIAERHGNGPGLHLAVQRYFLEAFGVPIVRGVGTEAVRSHSDLGYAFLNQTLVREIAENRGTWDDGTDLGANGESWLGPASRSCESGPTPNPGSTEIPELRGCWNALSTAEKAFMRRTVESANRLHETVKLLSLLAERLQARVNDLEPSQLAKSETAS